jgi:predicted negative regulator of RcsB-dependent stress response
MNTAKARDAEPQDGSASDKRSMTGGVIVGTGVLVLVLALFGLVIWQGFEIMRARKNAGTMRASVEKAALLAAASAAEAASLAAAAAGTGGQAAANAAAAAKEANVLAQAAASMPLALVQTDAARKGVPVLKNGTVLVLSNGEQLNLGMSADDERPGDFFTVQDNDNATAPLPNFGSKEADFDDLPSARTEAELAQDTAYQQLHERSAKNGMSLWEVATLSRARHGVIIESETDNNSVRVDTTSSSKAIGSLIQIKSMFEGVGGGPRDMSVENLYERFGLANKSFEQLYRDMDMAINE